ncbi:MAG: ATP-dependent zinc protease [Bacteroidia bacterium]
MKHKLTIGRFDKADFLDFGLENLDVKIDTGAYGCSIHCDYIEEVDEGGKNIIKFRLLDPEHLLYTGKTISANNYTKKTVKSSSGKPENRFVVVTKIRLFNQVFEIKISLTNRGEMKFPVLLGRTLLSRNFIVDTARTNLSYKEKIKPAQ